MANFTQGIWSHNNQNGRIWADENKLIAEVFGATLLNCSHNSTEYIANARLIAAAPQMYKWIENARTFLFDLKRYAKDEDEMLSHSEELNSIYKELITASDLMLVFIDNQEENYE